MSDESPKTIMSGCEKILNKKAKKVILAIVPFILSTARKPRPLGLGGSAALQVLFLNHCAFYTLSCEKNNRHQD